jgi:hypothetical protein
MQQPESEKLGSVTAAADRTMVEASLVSTLMVTVGEIGDKTEPLLLIRSRGLQRSVPIRTSARCWPMVDRCGGDTRVTHAGAASPLRIGPSCSGLGFTGQLPERKEQVSWDPAAQIAVAIASRGET